MEKGEEEGEVHATAYCSQVALKLKEATSCVTNLMVFFFGFLLAQTKTKL